MWTCRCLREAIGTRVLSDNDKGQFLKFLGLLMEPVLTDAGEEKRLLSPQELVQTFVLPSLSSTSESLKVEELVGLLNR